MQRSIIAAHRAALAKVRKGHRGVIVLIGKSMGSRIGCHVALEDKVSAVICLGYTLCGAGDRAKMRDEVLLQLQTPILFVQGTRDPLCPLDLLKSVRARMVCHNRMEIVTGGDHSLAVAKRALKSKEETQADTDARLMQRIEESVRKLFLSVGR